MTSFDFLSSLVITRSVLDLTIPVTLLLQDPAIDIVDAIHPVESLKSIFVVNTILLIPFIKSVTVISSNVLAR